MRNSNFNYQSKSDTQLKSDFIRRLKAGKNGFFSFDDFKNWYNNQDKLCSYCKISEIDCQKIVCSGILTSARFPINGKPARGKARGMWLEVDRKDTQLYSSENCVLACYFCNNDKSDVFTFEQYKAFRENRYEYLKKLL